MTRRLRIALAAAVLAAPMLSSCGFGLPTDLVYQPGVGINNRTESVDVLNALVVTDDDGGTGTLVGSLVNNDGENDDALVEVRGSGKSSGLAVEIAEGRVPVPSDGLVQLVELANISVEGEPVKPGYVIELTYVFERSGNVNIKIPVQGNDPDSPYGDIPLPSAAPASGG